MLYQFRQEPDAALKAAAESRDICAQHHFDYYGAWASLVRAWAIAESGRLDEGLADFDAALEDFRRTSAGLRIPHHLGLLAALHRKAGNAMAGLRLIDEAVAIAQASLESWCDVELHRERGELLLLAAGEEADNQADAEFATAIEIAASQGAKLPGLRASLARARLHAARGSRRATLWGRSTAGSARAWKRAISWKLASYWQTDGYLRQDVLGRHILRRRLYHLGVF